MQSGKERKLDEEHQRIKRQLTEWGAPDEVLEKLAESYAKKASGIEADVDVWQENRVIVELFMLLATQWQINQMTGQRIALNWQAVEIGIRNHRELLSAKDEEKAEIFYFIQRMEIAALVAMRDIEREVKNDESDPST